MPNEIADAWEAMQRTNDALQAESAWPRGFEKAQSDYDHAEPDDPDECRCPDGCVTCNQEAPGLYCCGRCQDDEDDGPDPDDVRDRRIEREMEDGSE